jgi:hypothetical protein
LIDPEALAGQACRIRVATAHETIIRHSTAGLSQPCPLFHFILILEPDRA